MIDLRCSFFVVSSGKLIARSNRICAPNTERVPVPVRSVLVAPRASTVASRSRYWRSPGTGRGPEAVMGGALIWSRHPAIARGA